MLQIMKKGLYFTSHHPNPTTESRIFSNTSVISLFPSCQSTPTRSPHVSATKIYPTNAYNRAPIESQYTAQSSLKRQFPLQRAFSNQARVSMEIVGSVRRRSRWKPKTYHGMITQRIAITNYSMALFIHS